MASDDQPRKGLGLSREAFEQEVAEEITKDLKSKPGADRPPSPDGTDGEKSGT